MIDPTAAVATNTMISGMSTGKEQKAHRGGVGVAQHKCQQQQSSTPDGPNRFSRSMFLLPALELMPSSPTML
jgi:hypothetical protein